MCLIGQSSWLTVQVRVLGAGTSLVFSRLLLYRYCRDGAENKFSMHMESWIEGASVRYVAAIGFLTQANPYSYCNLIRVATTHRQAELLKMPRRTLCLSRDRFDEQVSNLASRTSGLDLSGDNKTRLIVPLDASHSDLGKHAVWE